MNQIQISKKNYSQLPTDLQMEFQNVSLDMVILKNYNDEDIEEMFTRLQNGTPLNAAEKRRALQSDMKRPVANLSLHIIFKNRCYFKDTRFAFEDTIAKIIHFHLNEKIVDIRPNSIRNTYEEYADIEIDNKRVKEVKSSLDFIESSFNSIKINPKFKKNTLITLAFLTTYLLKTYNIRNFKSEYARAYIDFESKRIANEKLSEENQNGILAAYTDATRSDSVANMTYRHDTLLNHIVSSIKNLEVKDNIRFFTEEQRLAIYHQNDGICQICSNHVSQDEFHADHIIAHSNGGKTKITNGQVTCPSCNLKKSNN